MKLILITLVGVVVGMMVACSSEPVATPTPPGPMLTEAESIAVVKNYLGLKNLGVLNCGAYFDARDPRWTASYDGNGVWKVRVDVLAEEVLWNTPTVKWSKNEQRYRDNTLGKWDLYEKTKSVVVTSNNNC